MSASAKVVCVKPDLAWTIWPKVEHWVRAAMERGGLGLFDDVKEDVLNGDALAWLVWDEPNLVGVVITQITEDVCCIVACGGDGILSRLPLLKTIEQYAIAEGCARMRIMGRKGWLRALPDYREHRIVLEKDLR
jgi:hypothetical protein